ncbi:MAG: peptidase M14 [Ignavibacteriales bacterium]|nr:peptidase M14 [Ignavibacteriales bacterium]MCB9258075.1 peptidase M14 [Ignavibacteriales bacterium]
MKSLTTLIFLLIIFTGNSLTQEFNSENLYNSYQNFKETDIRNKIFKHAELKSKIKNIKKNKIFKVETAGKSLEGKEIFMLSIGTGKTKVLLWSQMHGDETTATMALFDLFNFFENDKEFTEFKDQLLKKIKIYFIPMLNPDGAELYQRRNELNIDLNRDALRLEFPESKILKAVRDSLKPKFAFNLHDQNTRYTSGNSYHSATISFLAPAFNYEKDINDVRGNTMKVIVNLFEELSKYIPGHIAKYKDDFEPRAFGDNFMKWGTGSILIESGGWKNDEEKQFIRKLNFISILTGLNSIANKIYENADINVYHNIPFNDNLLFDLLLRNLSVKHKNKNYTVDVGINRIEEYTKDQTQNYYVGKIEDWGDLSIFYGYDELDLSGYEIKPSKIYNIELNKLNELDLNKLMKEGYGFVKVDTMNIKREFSSIPFNLVLSNVDVNVEPKYNGNANFTIWKGKKLCYNVINGFIYDITDDIYNQNNGIIFK